MSAADSEPLEILSVPFCESLIALSMTSWIFRVNSRRLGVLGAPAKRFSNLTDLGVPK